MKKFFLVVALAVVSLFGITNVYAMSESELRAKVNSSYTINGKTITIPGEYIKQFNDYLDSFNVSSADCDVIAGQIDYLKQVAKNKNVSSFSEFVKVAETEIRASASLITASTGVKVTIGNDGTVTVYKYNSDQVFTKLRSGKIVNTGIYNLLYIALGLSLLGAGLFAIKVKDI